MTKRAAQLTFAIAFFGCSVLALGGTDHQSKTVKQNAQQSSKKDEAAEGEKRFRIHCGRCHQPPEEIPPAAAGTILKHMRVRASLSKEDEQLILQYIRP